MEKNALHCLLTAGRWCWGYLGTNARVPLPACAVIFIRTTFP